MLGQWAEQWLEVSKASFGIAVLGANCINVGDKRRHCVGAWDERDRRMKELFVELSSIRIVAVESRKFEEVAVTAHEPYAFIDDNREIDAIIVDDFPAEMEVDLKKLAVPVISAAELGWKPHMQSK